MKIRIAGFIHPTSDKSLVYREVKSLKTLFQLIKKGVRDGANLFSIRLLEGYMCPKCKDQELIPEPVNAPTDHFYCHACNKSFKVEEVEDE